MKLALRKKASPSYKLDFDIPKGKSFDMVGVFFKSDVLDSKDLVEALKVLGIEASADEIDGEEQVSMGFDFETSDLKERLATEGMNAVWKLVNQATKLQQFLHKLENLPSMIDVTFLFY